jgi:hypothetical protein
MECRDIGIGNMRVRHNIRNVIEYLRGSHASADGRSRPMIEITGSEWDSWMEVRIGSGS